MISVNNHINYNKSYFIIYKCIANSAPKSTPSLQFFLHFYILHLINKNFRYFLIKKFNILKFQLK